MTETRDDLNLVSSNTPIPSIEIDRSSLPSELQGYADFVSQALSPFAKKNPEVAASIYVYMSPSVNWGYPTSSMFIGACTRKSKNSKAILDILLYAFRAVKGVNIQRSDYINPAASWCEFHIEDGLIWLPVDDTSWYTEDASHQETQSELEESSDDSQDTSALRYRAARSDATVGTIKRKIEEVFGLPEGSVVLQGKNAKPLRSDATIGTLRKRWD